MKLFYLYESADWTIEQHHDKTPNAFIIKTKYGYIDYVHKKEDDTNEIWWVESKKPGYGSYLIDLMQLNHFANNIAWGVTSKAGEALAQKWHKNHPQITMITGPHEGQFDPF